MAKYPGDPTDFESFLTWDALTDILSYDPGTGEFRWIKTGRLGWVGRLAGSVDYHGYRRVEILGRSYYASRLAFLYMKKKWPKGLIDHINGNRVDDRWVNLREASRVQNGRNRNKKNKNNTSGVSGVYSQNGKWVASIVVERKRKYLGGFDTIEEAKAARVAAESIYFGKYGASNQGELELGPSKSFRDEPIPKYKKSKGMDFESALTQDILMRLLSYNPADGEFVWRSNETNPRRIKIGDRVGTPINDGGYLSVQIMGHRFLLHRLAWLYMKGQWPKAMIDHINQNKQDNRWDNLREVSRRVNAINWQRENISSSGERYIYPRGPNWRVWVSVDHKGLNIGTFSTLDEAISARDKYLNSLTDYLARSK